MNLINPVGFYCVLWAVALFIRLYSRPRLDIGTFMVFYYFVLSLFSYQLSQSEFYSFGEFSLANFIFLFTLLKFGIMPLTNLSTQNVSIIQLPSRWFFYTICGILTAISIYNLPKVLGDLGTGFTKLLVDSNWGTETYNEYMANTINDGDGAISNLASIITNAFNGITALLFFSLLIIPNSNFFLITGTALTLIVEILASISRGQRGGIIEVLLVFIATFFLFRDFLTVKIKRILIYVQILFLIICAIPFILLTTSRFDYEDGRSQASLYYYGGQQNLNFNLYSLNNGGIRYGDRTLPLLKRAIGFNNVPRNFWDRRNKYRDLKINDEVFITYVGDFFLDFGPYIGILIHLFLTGGLNIVARPVRGVINYSSLVGLHFLVHLTSIGGLKLYPFSDVAGNLKLLVYVLFFLMFNSGIVGREEIFVEKK